MAEQNDSQEKNEEPTDRRLERAFEEGSLMQPQDTYALGAWFAFLAGIPVIWYFATRMVAWFREIGIAIVRRNIDTQALLGGFLGDSLPVLGAALAIYLVITLAIGLAQQRFRIQFRPLRASLGNLSVSRGFSRIFGPRTLLQTAFNAAKLAVSGALLAMALAMLLDRYKMIGVGGTASEAADLALQASMLLIQIVLAMLVVFVVADLLVKRTTNRLQLRMSRQELKEELKDTDGRPEIKSKLAELRRKRRTTSRKHPLRTADVLLVNPTHYAVALLYEPGRMGAPIVIAKGTGLIARRLRWLAWREAVPIMRVPAITRRLYQEVAVDEPIPDDSFAEVAEILVQVYRMRRRSSPLHQ